MNNARARAIYKSLHRDVQTVIGEDFSVPLKIGDPRDFPKPRNMAFCGYRDGNSGRSIIIVIAPKLLHGDEPRVQAILRHELAHAVEFYLGEDELHKVAALGGDSLPDTPELRADAVAEIIWGDPIYYDRLKVQTLSRGQRPRPPSLPQ